MNKNIFLAIVLVVGIFGTTSFISLRSSSQLVASLIAFIEKPVLKDDSTDNTEPQFLENLEINRDDNGNMEVVATEKDLNDIIKQALAQEEKLQEFVHTASIRIFDGYIEFQANMEKPLKGNFLVRGRVVVKDGRLIPDIMKVKYGFFSIPTKLIISMIDTATHKQSPSEWVETPDITWKSAVFKPGKIVINFHEEEEDY